MLSKIAEYDVIVSYNTEEAQKNGVTISHFLYTKNYSASYLGKNLLI